MADAPHAIKTALGLFFCGLLQEKDSSLVVHSKELQKKAPKKKVKFQNNKRELIKRVVGAKSGKKKRNLKPGDVAVLMDPSAPQGFWPRPSHRRGLHDQRGLVHSVRMQTKFYVLERAGVRSLLSMSMGPISGVCVSDTGPTFVLFDCQVLI